MDSRGGWALVTVLLMFPQVVETLYSPALPGIGQGFGVSPGEAAQTLSVYVVGFAAGVLFWGRACDVVGRRPALLAGLACYAAGAGLALCTGSFGGLLLARVLSAFGAAVGSVVTQTVLRDRYQGPELMRVFAGIGVALAISPALGILLGTGLNQAFGYRGVFAGLVALALLLMAWSGRAFPETRPVDAPPAALWATLVDMLADRRIRWATLLVASFNAGVFAYYGLAAFQFERAGLAPALFGYSGLWLAAGSLLGARLGRGLQARGWSGARILGLAVGMNLGAGLGVLILEGSALFVLPMLLVMAAFALAIPQVLASALVDYGARRGTAGALFGLFYYLALGAQLAVIGWSQRLGPSLLACALAALLGALGYRRYLR